MMSDEMIERLAYSVANSKLGEGPSVRCEGPTPYEINTAREWVRRVLTARAAIEATTEIETCRWCAEPWNNHAKHCPILKLDSAPVEATTVKGDGLVERLRELARLLWQTDEHIASERVDEAADTITTLKGEIERLREEIVELWHKTDQTETRELHEVLGMTFEQYGAWLTARQALGSTDNVG